MISQHVIKSISKLNIINSFTIIQWFIMHNFPESAHKAAGSSCSHIELRVIKAGRENWLSICTAQNNSRAIINCIIGLLIFARRLILKLESIKELVRLFSRRRGMEPREKAHRNVNKLSHSFASWNIFNWKCLKFFMLRVPLSTSAPSSF